MSDETSGQPASRPVVLSTGLPETVLPELPPEWSAAIGAARREQGAARLEAARSVAADHPRLLDAWADLAELAAADGDHVAAYAFARVGYHRGLDALRAAGWRGSGYVRSSHETNHGFLRSLRALANAAAAIGEEDEAERCTLFAAQLDPPGGRAAGEGSGAE